MAKAIPSATYIEAKGAGHSVHHESPEWLIKTIADWLSAH